MEKYGLFIGCSSYACFTGTQQECEAQVDSLTDAQRERGWTIHPMSHDTYTGPVVDSGLVRIIWITAAALVVMALLLFLTVLTAR